MLSARRATIPQNRAQRRQQFLSTPSARRATESWQRQQCFQRISIHALREEGDPHLRGLRGRDGISIHALREEGDPEGGVRTCLRSKFLFTPSARRATISQ